MIQFFLEKADIRKLEVLHYLENSPSQCAFREVIIKELSITEFLLNKVIEELNLDFQKYNLGTDFKLEVSSSEIKLFRSSSYPSSQLELNLIKDSLTFSLVISLFFEEFISINNYAENNFLSYSTVYNKLSDIRCFFEKYDFTITKKNKIKGNETNIRLFFSYIFSEIYTQSLYIYPVNINEEADQLLADLEKYRDKPFKESEKIKLSHFFNVMLVRQSQKKFVAKETFYINKSFMEGHPTVNFLLTAQKKIDISIPREKCLNEVDDLLGYLVAKEFIKVEGYLDNVINPNFKVYSYNFINEVKETFPKLVFFMNNNINQIDLLHFNVLNFILPFEKELGDLNIIKMTDGFSNYTEFCKNYINKYQNNSEFWKFRRYLFHKYLLFLINGEAAKLNDNPIYLYVDFLYGKNYSNLIINVIKKISGYQIIFQDCINLKTDLILSDTYFENYSDVYQKIWKNFPCAKDWQDLIRRLEKIGNQKN